jgi:putative transposase
MFGYLPETQAYLKHAFREMKGFDWEGDARSASRAALKEVLEKHLRKEIQDLLQLAPYERGKGRFDYRNGSYVRHLLTEMGDVEICVPRLRGKIELKTLARYARRSQTVDRLILGCFILGHSTRKVARALAPLLGESVSSSTVSRISQCLDAAVAEYHGRRLTDGYRYLLFDGVVLKKRGPLHTKRRVFLCAYGIRWDGSCEMIDFYQAHGESQNAWEGFLNDLYRRGLMGSKTELIITDGGPGLHAALEVSYPRISKQRCWAHKVRNVLDKVKKRDQEKIKKMMNKIWGAANRQKATQAYWKLAHEWRSIYPGAVTCLEKDLDDLLAFYSIADSNLWKKIRTTNLIERAFREVKRRTRPMGVFTNKESMERIVFAVFHHLNNKMEMMPFKNFTQN